MSVAPFWNGNKGYIAWSKCLFYRPVVTNILATNVINVRGAGKERFDKRLDKYTENRYTRYINNE